MECLVALDALHDAAVAFAFAYAQLKRKRGGLGESALLGAEPKEKGA